MKINSITTRNFFPGEEGFTIVSKIYDLISLIFELVVLTSEV